jgi:hypothetical protein
LKALLKTQQDEKSEIIEHFNDLVKDSDSEDELIEPSFDELLKDDENQQDEKSDVEQEASYSEKSNNNLPTLAIC